MNNAFAPFLNSAVTAFFLSVALPGTAVGQSADLDYLFERLAHPDLVEWAEVEGQIQKALSASGSAALDLLLRRGREAMENDAPAQAVAHFSALIDHGPGVAEAWHARAEAYYVLGHMSLALADLEQALVLEERHFDAWRGLGIIMAELGRSELSLRAFRMASAIHPHDPDLRELLNRAELAQGAHRL